MDPMWVRWSEARRLSAGLPSGPSPASLPLHGAHLHLSSEVRSGVVLDRMAPTGILILLRCALLTQSPPMYSADGYRN